MLYEVITCHNSSVINGMNGCRMTQMDHQIRRVYLNVPHSKDVKPSWYGESVGHYEGDTLVVA